MIRYKYPEKILLKDCLKEIKYSIQTQKMWNDIVKVSLKILDKKIFICSYYDKCDEYIKADILESNIDDLFVEITKVSLSLSGNLTYEYDKTRLNQLTKILNKYLMQILT